jgi:hypothetical protein
MSSPTLPNPERLLQALQKLAYGAKSEALTVSDVGYINWTIARQLYDLLDIIIEYHASEIDREVENLEDNIIQKQLIRARIMADELAEIGFYLHDGDTIFALEQRRNAAGKA